MLDLKILHERKTEVKKSIQKRGMGLNPESVDQLLSLDATWRELVGKVEALRSKRNEASAAIPKLPKEEKPTVIAQVKELKSKLADLEEQLNQAQTKRDMLWRQLPNFLAADVPQGGEDDSQELKKVGAIPSIDKPKDHLELGKLSDTIDFEQGGKVSGAGFYYLKNEAVFLEQALLNFAVARAHKAGFTPIITPDLAKDEILSGIGFSPRGPETQVYSIADSDLSLVGTAEITLGGYHSKQVLNAEQLPLQYIGLSHCFRTEAGAHGKASKGLYRVHQFSKAELFVLCPPEDSDAWLEKLLAMEESIMQELGIAYRVLQIAAGDLGAPAYKKYDIEAWMPGRNDYGEVTSCSNCTDYQARRLGVRFKRDAKAKPEMLHMLNGTALATSRMLIAIYENYQQADSSISIPKALQPLMHGISNIPCRQFNLSA